MFLRVISESVIDEIPSLIFLPVMLSPGSSKMSLFTFLAPFLFDYFAIEFTNDISPLAGRFNISRKSSINPPNCTILDNWVFENFILVDEPFAIALRIFETCVSVNKNLWKICLMKDLKLLQFHFLFEILTYWVAN